MFREPPPANCSLVLLDAGGQRAVVIKELRRMRPDLTVTVAAAAVATDGFVVRDELTRPDAERLASELAYHGARVEVRGPALPVEEEPSHRPIDWLQHQTSFAEVEAAEGGGPSSEHWEELKRQATPGCQLWRFSSPAANWRAMVGRAGYALVKDGEIVTWVITEMN